MAEATDRMGLLTQNLVDAGCSEAERMQFLQLERERDGARNSCGCCGPTAPPCWNGSMPISGRSTAWIT